jgi:hypothetical protein
MTRATRFRAASGRFCRNFYKPPGAAALEFEKREKAEFRVDAREQKLYCPARNSTAAILSDLKT